jgi:transposase
MDKDIKKSLVMAIGIDIGDKFSYVALVGRGGAILAEERLKTSREHFKAFFSPYKGIRVVCEAGTHSPWISALLKNLGVDLLVANPNNTGRAIAANGKKNDKLDAVLLAELGLNSPRLLRPIRHRGRGAQADLAVIRARDALVSVRTKMINAARGLVKSWGARLRAASAEAFSRSAGEDVPEELKPALDPLLEMIDRLTGTIRDYDKKIKKLCSKYPETGRLQQIAGVGPLVSLAYVLTLESPKHFKKSRQTGAFLGLVTRQNDSGELKPQLRITKAGNCYLRQLLVTAAHYILSCRGPDCDLKRFGDRLSRSGGKRGKKKAVVAVARKLAVLLHRLWSSGVAYDPLYNANKLKRRRA